jgi:hypothetical protein
MAAISAGSSLTISLHQFDRNGGRLALSVAPIYSRPREQDILNIVPLKALAAGDIRR